MFLRLIEGEAGGGPARDGRLNLKNHPSQEVEPERREGLGGVQELIPYVRLIGDVGGVREKGEETQERRTALPKGTKKRKETN